MEVRGILTRAGTTALLVTHNQHEAFSDADKIGVLFEGRMQQWDNAYGIYHKPVHPEVASFVGEDNLINGRVAGPGKVKCCLGILEGNLSLPWEQGCEIDILVRPEDILHIEESSVEAEVLHKSFQRPKTLYLLQLSPGEKSQALVSNHHNHSICGAIGIVPEVDNIIVSLKKDTFKA